MRVQEDHESVKSDRPMAYRRFGNDLSHRHRGVGGGITRNGVETWREEEHFPTWLIPPPPPQNFVPGFDFGPSSQFETSHDFTSHNAVGQYNEKNLPGLSLLPWLLSMSLVTGIRSPPPTSGKLREVFRWGQLDFTFPSALTRDTALSTGAFVPANTLPLGLEVWRGRVFVSLPRWKPGVPATLATVAVDAAGATHASAAGAPASPLLRPFPSWAWHVRAGCDGLTSVFRMAVDSCDRLWVMDSGAVDIIGDMKQKCSPQILVFDLATYTLLWRYVIPDEQVKPGGLFTNIAVDVRQGRCDDAFAYVSDVFRYGLVVYSWREDRSWRAEHPLFFPDPMSSAFELHGIRWRWTDGVFGLALGPQDTLTGDRTLFFHPLASFREFAVRTSALRNETTARDLGDEVTALGEQRSNARGHAAGSAADRNGVLFYNLVTRDAVGCWNSRQPLGHRMDLQGIVAQDNITLRFPNDLKVDQEHRQNVWVLSNRLHEYLYSQLDPSEVNFRILSAPVDEAVRGTVCDPDYRHAPPVENNIASGPGCDANGL